VRHKSEDPTHFAASRLHNRRGEYFIDRILTNVEQCPAQALSGQGHPNHHVIKKKECDHGYDAGECPYDCRQLIITTIHRQSSIRDAPSGARFRF
jgi:hypothetical protein